MENIAPFPLSTMNHNLANLLQQSITPLMIYFTSLRQTKQKQTFIASLNYFKIETFDKKFKNFISKMIEVAL